MNLMKLANPVHVAHEAAGLAGTVAGAAGTVVGRTVVAGREALHRVTTAAENAAPDVDQAAPDRAPQAGPPLPGADLVEFEPRPPADPPVDVVGAALSADQDRPVTEGGAFVEATESDPT